MTSENQREILDVYYQYHTIVKEMVIALEIDDGEYPVEILNEIRAMMNHLAKCYIADDKKPDNYLDIISKNIHNAKSHLRRAIFDCYKYGCLSADDFYRRFHESMKNVDLGVIDNGSFVVVLSQKYTKAKALLKGAKIAEQDLLDSSIPDSIYEKYQIAYEAFDAMRVYIEEKMELIERTRHKQQVHYVMNNIFGIAGLLGLFFTILFHFI